MMRLDYSPIQIYRRPPPVVPMRTQVEALEREIQKLPQIDCPVWHFFALGLYARKMLIRKGTVLTGAVHRTEHLAIVSGDIEVTTDDGMCRITDAHFIFTSTPGVKRAGFAHADTFFTTVHATTETDLDRLIEELTESTGDELLGGAQNIQALAQRDRDDYTRFLAEYGLTQDWVTRLVENAADQIPMPDGFGLLELRESVIAGIGLFVTRDIAEDTFIAPARVGEKRTPAGRYTNHSLRANAVFLPSPEGGLDLYAARSIRAGEEVTVNYRQAMSVNGAGIAPIGGHS